MKKQIKYLPMIFYSGGVLHRQKGFYHLIEDCEFKGDNHLIFVTDPYCELTGRYEVDPIDYYGLTDEWLERWEKAK